MQVFGCLFVGFFILIVILAFQSSLGEGIFVLSIIISLVWLVISLGNRSEKKIKEAQDGKKRNLESVLYRAHNYNPTNQITSYDNECIFSYDENTKKINFTDFYDNKIYTFKDIIQSEIILNEISVSKTSRGSQLGGALVGGALFGGVGAVVGGLSGDTKIEGKIKKIQLKITVNDTENPNRSVLFFDSPTELNKDEPRVKDALEQVNDWNSRISILIKRYDKEEYEQRQSLNHMNHLNYSIADELMKLSELLKQGLISHEEFETQKSKLLNS